MSKKQDAIQDDPNAPRNDFLPFASTANANVVDQATYQTMEARTGGFVSGVAKSMQLNKVWRQSSIVAASIGQYINNRTGKDVIDDGDVLKLAALFEEAVKKTSGGGVPLGGIIAWSGSAAAIPAGYSLCDGKNGTPNLEGRFILGGADKGTAGGSMKITVGNLPPHTHTGSTSEGGAHSHEASDPGHTHSYTSAIGQAGTNVGGPIYRSDVQTGASKSNVSIQGVGNHSHGMSLNNTGNGEDYLPPYFQLCYIMRTSEEL